MNRLPFKTRTGVLFALLFVAGSLSAYNGPEPRLGLPAANRIVRVNFLVDNKTLLEKPFLEVSIIEDGFSKRMVSLEKGLSDSVGTGASEMSVPDGTVHLAVCGLVKCSAAKETELVCGKTAIPAAINVLYQHEVTFSTSWACRENSSAIASR